MAWDPVANEWVQGDVSPQGPQGDEGPKGTAGYSPINFAEFTMSQGMGDDGTPLLLNAPWEPVVATTINPCCFPEGNGTVRFNRQGAFVAQASFGWNSGEGGGQLNNSQPSPGSLSFYTSNTGYIARSNIPSSQRDVSVFCTHNSNQLGGVLQVRAFKTNASYHTVRARLAVWSVQ
jgi:hypothetical protein